MCSVLWSGSPVSEEQVEDVARQLRVLADPARLTIINLIAAAESGEICACDLPEELAKSQSTVSHHLSQLVDAGILHREQRGKWAWFRLDGDRLEDIRRLVAAVGR